MVRLRVSVAYMVLMIAGAVVVEGAIIAIPVLAGSPPHDAIQTAEASPYTVEVRDLGEGQVTVEMRPRS